jgi:hypothetical protein
MAIVADNTVIHDASFTLAEDGEMTFTFELPEEFHPGTSKQRPILAYMANPGSDVPLAYQIDINGQQAVNETFTRAGRRGVWEVLPGDILMTPGQNNIQFRLESGSSTITFRDVVLWFQRTVTTP